MKHEPAVRHRLSGKDVVLGLGISDLRAYLVLPFFGKAVHVSVALHEQVQPAHAFRQVGFPAFRVEVYSLHGSQSPRKSRCLGIHHPPGHVVKQGIGTFRNIQESVAHQVLHPYLKVGYASQYLLVPLLLPLGLSRFIHRGFAFGFLLLLFGLLRSFGKPRRHPFRLFRLRELVWLAGVQQQQAKPMLAREFAARAGTLERNVIQVYHRLVGILSASLAMTPDGTSAAFLQYPFAQGRKSFASLYR